jgi:PDZ domain-containing protein
MHNLWRASRASQQLRVKVLSAPQRIVLLDVGPEPDSQAELVARIGLEISERAVVDARPLVLSMEALSGPSAGLAHALAYLDALDPGSVTGALRVAATGVVETDGTVGSVGWLPLKLEAAQLARADVVFIPLGQSHEAPRSPVKVVEVGSVRDAVEWLCSNGATGVACNRMQSRRLGQG